MSDFMWQGLELLSADIAPWKVLSRWQLRPRVFFERSRHRQGEASLVFCQGYLPNTGRTARSVHSSRSNAIFVVRKYTASTGLKPLSDIHSPKRSEVETPDDVTIFEIQSSGETSFSRLT